MLYLTEFIEAHLPIYIHIYLRSHFALSFQEAWMEIKFDTLHSVQTVFSLAFQLHSQRQLFFLLLRAYFAFLSSSKSFLFSFFKEKNRVQQLRKMTEHLSGRALFLSTQRTQETNRIICPSMHLLFFVLFLFDFSLGAVSMHLLFVFFLFSSINCYPFDIFLLME